MGGDDDDQPRKVKSKVLLFHPNQVFMQRWDAAMTFLLLFTAVVTPFEVAFLAEDGSFLKDDSLTPATGGARELMKTQEILILFIVNRMVDLGFMADIFVNFNLAYFDAAGRQVDDNAAASLFFLHSFPLLPHLHPPVVLTNGAFLLLLSPFPSLFPVCGS